MVRSSESSEGSEDQAMSTTGGYIHYGDDVWWKQCLVQSRQMEIPVHRAAPPGNYEFSKRDEVVLRIKM